MTPSACPADHELLPSISDEPVSAGVLAHLEGCSHCRQRVALLKTEVQSLRRQLRGGLVLPLPAAGGISPSADGAEEDNSTEDSPGTLLRNATSGSDDPASPDPAKIGKYLVVGVLDTGGQAEVYRVVHPTLSKDLVLKLSKTRYARASADRDFLVAEGKLLADLEHPNLVRVFDLDFDDDRPFLVMEYVRGGSLQQQVEHHRPAPRQSARWVAQLARAVAMVHRRGIVHQDIKPRNILIDESGRSRLIDFGLAHWQDAWSGTSEPPGGGTLAYMAPEQARDERERIGPCTDIFALGGVLYFLLTGQAPFRGQSKAEVWGCAARCDFDHGVLRARGTPRRLERICLRAMAAEPGERYADADALAADLERFVRRPRVVLAGATVAVVLFVLAGVWLATRPVPRESPSQVAVPQVKLHPGEEPGQRRSEPLTITAFQVDLHRRNPPQELGAVGTDVFAGRLDDDVRVYFRLNAPAYCYLIALNPDGKLQLCVPADETTPPARTADVAFPADPADGFSLTDGIGLQGFVLIAARDRLPPYRDWLARQGGLPWQATTADRGWRFDGGKFIALEHFQEDRGSVRKLADLPGPFAAVCRALKSSPGTTSIQAIAFPVQPKDRVR
jgi:tRNA A-37 threonylcarbamoyl transferase component Bud32